MRPVNLYIMTRNRESSLCSKFENVISGREKRQEIKEREYESLCRLVDELNRNGASIQDMEGFYFSYTISQISKEFDLLKIKQGEKILNIELKSEMISEERIKKQLVRNRHYLRHIAEEIMSFTYVADTNCLFELQDGELVQCDIASLIAVLKPFKEFECDINRLFRAKDYLISPLNTPEKFLSEEYFLTDAQEEIKAELLKDARGQNARRFWGITGKAGTGKTLLLYDLARELSLLGPVCVIHCGILCEGHYFLQGKIDNLNLIDAKSINSTNLGEYQYIVVDETQRIYKDSLEKICTGIQNNNQIGIFSYDDFQTLSKREEEDQIVDVLKSLHGFREEKLTTKIRTNEEMAAFIKMLLKLNDTPGKAYKYNDIDIVYANSVEEANDIISYYQGMKQYIFIEYTKSIYSPSVLDRYHGNFNTHQVIGQEFDNVIVVMDDNFSYGSDGRLMAQEHPVNKYLFYKLFFQGISRAREKLCIVVVNNPELFKKVIDLKYNVIP